MSLCITGCSLVTTYGKDPEPIEDEDNAYSFTLYFNMFSIDDVEEKANDIAKSLQKEHGCKSYELEQLPQGIPGTAHLDFIVRLEC
jgi:hypothetical protein